MGGVRLEVDAFRRLKGFQLQVRFSSARERTVIFGPSGGGKSMTLRAIAGALRLDRGRISVGEAVLYDSQQRIDLPAHARHVGYVPQGYALFPHMSVAQNVLYGATGAPDKARLLKDLLELTDLEGLAARRPVELSGGQQQRVSLARALASEPRLLLLDEPFSALDASLRRTLRDEVTDLQRRTGVPLVTVTHDLQDAFELGDEIVVIAAGKVLQQGPREDLFYRPASRQVAQLVGMRNLLAARVVGRTDSGVQVRWNGQVLEAVTMSPLGEGAEVNLCVRPSQIMVRRGDEPPGGRVNLIAGRIEEEIVTPEGYRLKFTPDGGDASLEIELSGYTYFRLGLDSRKAVEVSIRPEALHVIQE